MRLGLILIALIFGYILIFTHPVEYYKGYVVTESYPNHTGMGTWHYTLKHPKTLDIVNFNMHAGSMGVYDVGDTIK